jgi:ribosomal peptide maturation radical SAM protein 1
MTKYRIAEYPIIGFSTTFEQNLASVALARTIKESHPQKLVVFGGANCEGVMGVQLLKSFPWIDYVCTGEGETAFPELLRSIVAGKGAGGVAGIVHRAEESQVVDNGPAALVTDMDTVPIPDYDDYFATLAQCGFSGTLNPALLIETSRGCWWGAKSHCTFCGLNGKTMCFRSKSPDRVLHELKELKSRHGLERFVAVDNNLDMGYFQSVLPSLRDQPLGISLFYETTSHLKEHQVALLRAAGVSAVQPGIESLNSHVLRLMRKGVSAIQNVQLLKWCKEYGVTVAWNLLYGIPGETREDYEKTLELMDALFHLPPPHSLGPVRIDRFSPYFNAPELFGLENVRPFPIYQYIYPLSSPETENLAYFFEADGATREDHAPLVEAILRKAAEWRAANGCSLTREYGEDFELLIHDSRPNRVHSYIVLNGVQREVYDLCHERQILSRIRGFLEARYGVSSMTEDWLRQFLTQMVDWRLMVREGEQYLSVATRVPRPA